MSADSSDPPDIEIVNEPPDDDVAIGESPDGDRIDDRRARWLVTNRRNVLLGLGSLATFAAIAEAGLDSNDGGGGTLYGGTMALDKAYKVGPRTYLGPDSAKSGVLSSIPDDEGWEYHAADTDVDYYLDGGSWNIRSIGSDTKAVPEVKADKLDIGDALISVPVGGDASDVQSAIDSLPSGGGMVFVPEGTFTITGSDQTASDSINPDSNVHIRGVGENTVFKMADSTQLNVFDFTGKTDVRISNVKIDGNKANQPSGNFKKNGGDELWNSGILADNCERVVIDNCTLVDIPNNAISFYHGTSRSAMLKNKIRDFEWHGCQNWEGTSGAGSNVTELNRIVGNDIKITDGEAHGNGITVEITTNARRMTITDNIIEGSDWGITCRGEQNVIANNRIIDCIDQAIRARSQSSQSTLSQENLYIGNIIRGADAGIDFSNGARACYAIGNVVVDVTGNGIYMESDTSDIFATDNIVRANERGIYVQGDNCQVNDNHVYNQTDRGIIVSGSENVVSDNTVKGSSGVGIELGGSGSNNSVKGNVSVGNNRGIDEDGSITGDNNVIEDNYLDNNSSSSIRISAPNTITRWNRGYVTEARVLSGTFAIDSTGLKSVTIAHGLDEIPAKEQCSLTVVEDSDVNDWAYNVLKVVSTNATNVEAEVDVSSASSTSSATAKLALDVETWM